MSATLKITLLAPAFSSLIINFASYSFSSGPPMFISGQCCGQYIWRDYFFGESMAKVPIMDEVSSHTAYQRSFRLF